MAKSIGLTNQTVPTLHSQTVAKKLWSWRESNPRPDEENRCFLHAYSSVNFRYLADVGQPTRYLST